MTYVVVLTLVAVVALVLWQLKASVLSVLKADVKAFVFELEKLAVKAEPGLQRELFVLIQKLKNIL